MICHTPSPAIAFGLALVEVKLEVVETRDLQVERRTDQVRLVIALTKLVSCGNQHIADRPELELLAEDLAQRKPWRELAVIGVIASGCVFLAVVEDLVDEEEVVAVLPAVRVLKGEGLLIFRVDSKVSSIEIGQAITLPLEDIPCHGGCSSQQTAGQ